ncbi:YcbK family protein [Hoeflea sp. TYP-13]|uniref:YcbK family protein n=1 Tax=Hoeflea sp. TYP-13 TaxID=3230023 RepID=UPI0034C5FAC4
MIAVASALLLAGCVSSSDDASFGLLPQADVGETADFPTTGYAGSFESDADPTPPAEIANAESSSVEALDTGSTITTSYAAPIPVPRSQVLSPQTENAAADASDADTISEDAETGIATNPAAKKKTPSRLARLFSFGKPRPSTAIVDINDEPDQRHLSQGAVSNSAKPVIRERGGEDKLPGVRLGNLFGFGQRTSADTSEPIQVASAAGLARLVPNGLRRQHDKVNTACLKPELVRLLASVRRHYGRDVIITSGYRSSKRNRRAGGVRASRHTTCEAADIQVPGVSKWNLAKYLRTVDGRGGVGTYCHTKSVHIDIGTRRDWNWRCKRR